MFKNIQKAKYVYQKTITVIFQTKLLRKVIQNWKKFVTLICHEKANYILAKTHYSVKLKQSTLSSMVIFKNNSKKKKFQINSFRQSQNRRLISKCFHNLKLLKNKRKLKMMKIEMAEDFYIRYLRKKMLYKLKAYVKYCKNKRLLMENEVAKIMIQLKLSKVKFLFMKWKKYYFFRILKKQKMTIAVKNAEKRVLQIHIKAWRNFWLHRKLKQSQIIQVGVLYSSKLMNKYFYSWKHHVRELLWFRQNLTNAIDLYKRHIIEEGLLLIVRCGFLQKDENYKKCKQIFSKQLFLTYKYFNLWRRKTLKLFLEKKNTTEFDIYCSTGNLEWYPICVLAPRIY